MPASHPLAPFLGRLLRWTLLVVVLWALAPESGRADGTVPGDSLRWRGPVDLAVAVDTLTLAKGQVRIDLSHAFVQEMLELTLDGYALIEGRDVTLVADRGFLALANPARGGERLRARYRFDPAGIAPQLALHRPQGTQPEAPAIPEAMEPPGSLPVLDTGAPVGALRIQGSKTVSVQGGTNRDATVDQGLRLTVTGQLTPGIGVRAEISDENLPITPEGNTEQLSDLDQVRIELFGPRGRVVLGDFHLLRQLGAFVPYERKLQGLWLTGLDARGSASLLVATPRGRRREVEIRGREGVQGPYELLDGQRLDQSFIVAGSERVWVNGEPVTRGLERDYVIDYVRGTITFTELRPIGPETRIAVDFETSSTGYHRNVFAAQGDSLAAGPLRFHVAFVQEADDPNRPTEGELSAADRDSLAAAGDDPRKALGSGVVFVPNKEGHYDERFTTGGVRYFAFADSAGGDYDVTFLRVGPGEGDYVLNRVTRDGVLDFEYVGPGAGDYVVGRQLPLPEETQVVVARVDAGDRARGPWLAAEADLSNHDANRLSALDEGNDQDIAWKMAAATPWLFDADEGEGLRLSGLAEAIGRNFAALGRLREPFFYDPWNLQDEPRQQREGHESARLDWKGSARGTQASLDRLHRLGAYDGLRATWQGSGQVFGPFHWTHVLATTSAQRAAGEQSRRRDRAATLAWHLPVVQPYGGVADERFTDEQAGRHRGYRSQGWSAGVRSARPEVAAASLEFRREIADSLAVTGDTWRFARDVRQWQGLASTVWHSLQLQADLSWRKALLPGDVDATTRLGRVRVVRRPQEGGLGVDVEYRAGTEQARVLGREIVFVGLGEGDYDAEGNRVGVRQGDYNVIYTPSDSLVSSTNVELNTKVDWSPRSMLLGGFTSGTLLQIRERSRAEDAGAVLRLSPSVLRNPEFTILGERRFREDLTLLRSSRRFDLRLTYDRSDVLDQQFTQGPERSVRQQRIARLESDLGRGLSLGLEGGDEVREREADVSANPLLRSYDVTDRSVGSTLRYRASARRRASVLVRWTRRNESLESIDQRVLETIPSLTTDFLTGRWTIEARWVDITEESSPTAVRPFFFEFPGTGRSASVSAQWALGRAVTLTLRYQIRDEAQRLLRQDMAVETRARF